MGENNCTYILRCVCVSHAWRYAGCVYRWLMCVRFATFSHTHACLICAHLPAHLCCLLHMCVCVSCAQRKIVSYDSPLLLQGVHDKVVITLHAV